MYKALTTFCGAVSMAEGDVANIKDKDIVTDLLEAGYIEEVGKKKAEPKPASKKAVDNTDK